MQRSSNFHENLARNEQVKLGSNKKFGLVMSLFFLILAVYPYLNGLPLKNNLFIVSFVFLICALIKPEILYYPNFIWMQLGRMLGIVVSPIILALLFFVVFMPIGLVLRLFKKDLLNMSLDKNSSTFWIQSNLTNQNFKDQF